MIYLRQSTASQEVLLGPFVDSTDGNTAETALTIANTDIKIFKAGATTLANKNSGGGTHISNGNYYAVLDATDTDTCGSGAIVVQVSGALAVRHAFHVLEEAVYDDLFAGSAAGYLKPTTAGRTLDVASTGEAGLDFANVNIPSTGAVPALNSIDVGTLQSATSTTAVLRAALSLGDDIINGAVLKIISGTGAGQSRAVDDFVGSTDTVTVSPAWTTTPDNTSGYDLQYSAPASTAVPMTADVTKWNGTAVSTPATAGIPDVNVKNIDNDAASASGTVTFPNATLASTTNITAGTVTTATNVTTVNGLAANVITAAATAADFTTEIQSGLATASALNTVDDFLDTEVAAILAAVDTEVAAIKAKTDQLTFTQAGHVDANIQRINDVTIVGDGSGTPFNV